MDEIQSPLNNLLCTFQLLLLLNIYFFQFYTLFQPARTRAFLSKLHFIVVRHNPSKAISIYREILLTWVRHHGGHLENGQKLGLI